MRFPRYPKYKDSGLEWLGELPEHWEAVRLKHAAEVTTSNVDKKEYEGEEPVHLCNYTDVYYNDRIDREMSFMRATASPSQIEKLTLRSGDVILTKDSETADDIARSAYVPRDLPGVVCGYHLSIARPRRGVHGSYLKRVFDTHALRAQAEVAANGLTRVGLSQSAMGDLQIPLPPEREQLVITDFLDHETSKIDALIEEQRRLIELLKEKRQAVTSHVVTKGIEPSPLKDSGAEWIGSIPVHWSTVRVSDLFMESRSGGAEGLPILSVSIHHGVSDKELEDDDLERTVNRSEDATKYKRVRPGDLTYNMMRAWQGAFGAVLVDGMVSPAYVVARPREGVSARYIERVLRTPSAIKEMKRYSKGVTDFRLRLYWDDFKSILVPLPPATERDAILGRLERLDALTGGLVTAAEQNITILRERRSALISAAVNGKIDVRQSARKPVASVKPYTSGFAHQLLAAQILSRCNDSHMGRTKLQKLIHVTEHHAQIEELRGEYTRKMAGPLDMKAVQALERGLDRLRWFKTIREAGRKRYRYVPLEMHDQHSKYLERWADKQARIDEVLSLMGGMNMRQCEIVSTLYAAWNDLLIDRLPVTDDAILAQAATAEGWHESKEKTPREKWTAALQWMKDKGLVPTGFGTHTRKAKTEDVHEPA